MTTLDQIVSELLDDEAGPIADDRLFADCDGWDSLKHVELIVALESRFGVELTADEISSVTSKQAARTVLAARQIDA